MREGEEGEKVSDVDCGPHNSTDQLRLSLQCLKDGQEEWMQSWCAKRLGFSLEDLKDEI